MLAAEFLREKGGGAPIAIGAYVSGNASRGLRNFPLASSPLNYSDLRGWDGSGAGSAEDDGEVWAAALLDVRAALVAAHGAAGGPRFARLVVASLPHIGTDATMLAARNALLARAVAADRARIWRAFARRGLGQRATGTVNVAQPRPSFESPVEATEASVTFRLRAPEERGRAIAGTVFVGRYEANVTPVADTIGATGLSATARFVPGAYSFVFRAPGYGAVRKTLTLGAGQRRVVTVSMPTNHASRKKGAAVAGPGSGPGAVADDTEATNWTGVAAGTVADGDLALTVNLAGTTPRTVDRIQVSALLRAASPEQNRFTALRSFEIRTCLKTRTRSCAASAHFTRLGAVYEPFAAVAPRPVTPDLDLRTIDLPNRKATHVRLVVLDNQCTGGDAYRGALETDPDHEADCVLGAPGVARTVRISEIQVFSRAPAVTNVRAR